jgi:hypothetical protein
MANVKNASPATATILVTIEVITTDAIELVVGAG